MNPARPGAFVQIDGGEIMKKRRIIVWLGLFLILPAVTFAAEPTIEGIRVSMEWGRVNETLRERIVVNERQVTSDCYLKLAGIPEQYKEAYHAAGELKHPQVKDAPAYFRLNSIQIAALRKNIERTEFLQLPCNGPDPAYTLAPQYRARLNAQGEYVLGGGIGGATVDGWEIIISVAIGQRQNQIRLANSFLPSFFVILSSTGDLNDTLLRKVYRPLVWLDSQAKEQMDRVLADMAKRLAVVRP